MAPGLRLYVVLQVVGFAVINHVTCRGEVDSDASRCLVPDENSAPFVLVEFANRFFSFCLGGFPCKHHIITIRLYDALDWSESVCPVRPNDDFVVLRDAF